MEIRSKCELHWGFGFVVRKFTLFHFCSVSNLQHTIGAASKRHSRLDCKYICKMKCMFLFRSNSPSSRIQSCGRVVVCVVGAERCSVESVAHFADFASGDQLPNTGQYVCSEEDMMRCCSPVLCGVFTLRLSLSKDMLPQVDASAMVTTRPVREKLVLILLKY